MKKWWPELNIPGIEAEIIDVQEHTEYVERLKVLQLPCVIFLQDDVEVMRIENAVAMQNIKQTAAQLWGDA